MMKKKIIAIGIICMFLTTGLATVSAVNVKEDEKTGDTSQNEGLPDLVVTNVWVETERGYGDYWNLYIYARVENKGNADAKSIDNSTWWTAYYLNGDKQLDSRPLETLKAGESTVLKCTKDDYLMFPILSRLMEHEIRVYTDSTCEVIESNDNNNNNTIKQPISRTHYRNPLFFNQNLIQNLLNLRIFRSNFIKQVYQRLVNLK